MKKEMGFHKTLAGVLHFIYLYKEEEDKDNPKELMKHLKGISAVISKPF